MHLKVSREGREIGLFGFHGGASGPLGGVGQIGCGHLIHALTDRGDRHLAEPFIAKKGSATEADVKRPGKLATRHLNSDARLQPNCGRKPFGGLARGSNIRTKRAH
jgi:hypothetical protein